MVMNNQMLGILFKQGHIGDPIEHQQLYPGIPTLPFAKPDI